MMEHFRKLYPQEIDRLTRQLCSASDWDELEVADGFSPDTIHHVHFSGHIRLGLFSESITEPDGFTLHAGIRHATLHNCAIGNQAVIDNVMGRIANYDISDHCVIQNIHTLAVEGATCFGNGVVVDCINEGGGREVVISESLTAQTAYLQACYRHRPTLVENLQNRIREEYPASTRGYVGHHTVIRDCKNLKNIRIGEYATLQGCSSLTNGTIVSEEVSPTFIGDDVFAQNFIVLDGSTIGEGSNIENCFIGQACQFGKGITAYHSLFFCNCQAFCGEIGSVFAGPYTVTHHKSTLLIAGQFSFFNAGSGTNQSNHYYRLGPIHQGTMERGAKAGSGSYILWPAHIGAYSLVKGQHLHHPNTENLPFSYLIENNGETILVPGANIKSAGTLRDIQKWPQRDGRKGTKRDRVTFPFLNPFILQKVVKGRTILKGMSEHSEEWISYQGCLIKRASLPKSIELYDRIIWRFIGDTAFDYVFTETVQWIAEELKGIEAEEAWHDLGGLILSQQDLDETIDICQYSNTQQIDAHMDVIEGKYKKRALAYAIRLWEQEMGKPLASLSQADLLYSLEQWEEAQTTLNEAILNDAKKEFGEKMQISYQDDFAQVRGSEESNAFIRQLIQEKKVNQHLFNIYHQWINKHGQQ